MKISQKLQQAHSPGPSKPTYSFEFFVPKTSQGVQNLYDRMDRMYDLGPQFIDITWNAGGRASNLTVEMVSTAQASIGLETCMHLTCTGMPKSMVENALKDAYQAGCQNILALRGDPPVGSEEEGWKPVEGGFSYAKDLVKYIKANYGDYFDIGVAAYPEGHPEEADVDKLITYLKEKVDAGATFIITQMFYDVDKFLVWVDKCRAAGIDVPIIPGIMPISTYSSFMRRAKWCQINIPEHFLEVLDPISGDDALVREKGTELVAGMCQKMLDSGKIKHLHFYTMNLEKATVMVLDELFAKESPGSTPVDALTPVDSKPTPPLPWRQSLALGRQEESVRPIFWKNRKSSYVARTQDWDEFPNGRWGDSRSPAFGELENYGVLLKHGPAKARDIWGEPQSLKDIEDLFLKYINNKIKSLPWSDSPITNEIDSIKPKLLDLNERGYLTINSQPAVNGARSSDPIYGWGPKNGYVYQKAYLEVLVCPSRIEKLKAAMDADPEVTYYYVNKHGNLTSNVSSDGGPNAVTWGIYPGKEVIQPTIVEKISFLAWKDEVFTLASEWSKCYPEDSKSRAVIQDMAENWYLINIVHNDFQAPDAIFEVFKE